MAPRSGVARETAMTLQLTLVPADFEALDEARDRRGALQGLDRSASLAHRLERWVIELTKDWDLTEKTEGVAICPLHYPSPADPAFRIGFGVPTGDTLGPDADELSNIEDQDPWLNDAWLAIQLDSVGVTAGVTVGARIAPRLQERLTRLAQTEPDNDFLAEPRRDRVLPEALRERPASYSDLQARLTFSAPAAPDVRHPPGLRWVTATTYDTATALAMPAPLSAALAAVLDEDLPLYRLLIGWGMRGALDVSRFADARRRLSRHGGHRARTAVRPPNPSPSSGGLEPGLKVRGRRGAFAGKVGEVAETDERGVRVLFGAFSQWFGLDEVERVTQGRPTLASSHLRSSVSRKARQ